MEREITMNEEELRGGIGNDPVPVAQPEPEAKNVQKIVDALVWEHGRNLRHWPDLADRLNAVGLSLDEVNEPIWDMAERHAAETLVRHRDAARLTWQAPVEGRVIDTDAVIWWTRCRTYH